jgi:hypothetical protein
MGAVLLLVAGCGLPQDQGVVMGCFGFVNETIPGQDVFSTQIVTNSFFGGCDPTDPGMQVVERATQAAAADQTTMVAACDTACNGRVSAYAVAHPEVNLPLSCQTLFAIPCDGLGSDVSQLPAGASTAFQGGGPADTRLSLTGTVTLTIDNRSTTVLATGIVDGTLAPCQGAGQNCTLTLSRFDVVPSQSFTVNGVAIVGAHVQNQGPSIGHQNAGEMLIPSGAIEAEVSANVGGSPLIFHVRSTSDVKSTQPNVTLEQFLSTLDLTMSQGNVSVRMQLTGTPVGRRPMAAFTPRQPTYECQCKSCTTVRFTSATTDTDSDLQGLSWQMDTVPQVGDASGAPKFIDFQLPIGPHTISLVATDSRGAASGSSLAFSVVDTTPPVVTPPPNVQLSNCSFPDIGQATATDTCSDAVLVSDSPGCFPVGTTTVTWIAQDSSFNEARARQTVTVLSVADTTCCPPGTNIIRALASGGTVNGTAGPDCIIGSSNNDIINGLGGNDYIIGNAGQDTINGGDGDDVILGGDGDDIIDGGLGNDRISGGAGQDRITGGPGDDILIGCDGDDIINGNDGNDRIFGNQGQDNVSAGPGNDYVEGGGSPGDGQTLNGDDGDDQLFGFINNDIINGGAGNDFIAGFDGDDHLNGGADNDTILGGRGHNVCTSGGGIDSISCLP